MTNTLKIKSLGGNMSAPMPIKNVAPYYSSVDLLDATKLHKSRSCEIKTLSCVDDLFGHSFPSSIESTVMADQYAIDEPTCELTQEQLEQNILRQLEERDRRMEEFTAKLDGDLEDFRFARTHKLHRCERISTQALEEAILCMKREEREKKQKKQNEQTKQGGF